LIITNITVESRSVTSIDPSAVLEVKASVEELETIIDSIKENNPVFVVAEEYLKDFSHSEIEKALKNTYPHKFI